jgi:hypothetical protein
MFSAPCIIVYQYTETNVVYFLLDVLRIKGLCMFRALLAHPQKMLHKRHLVHCVCFVMCYDVTRTQYTKCGLCSDSCGRASNDRNIQSPLILNKLNKK